MNRTPNITLTEPGHRYFDHNNQIEYTSWSKVMSFFKIPFDETGDITRATARRDGKSEAQQKKEWQEKGDRARNHGTRIHNALELYDKTTQIREEDKDLEPMIRAVASLFVGYRKTRSEVIYYSEKHKIAGTCDKPCFRSMGESPVSDKFDYKTNIDKGIYYHSKYNKWFKYPIQHIEDCNFSEYALQLSAYQYMDEVTNKIKPGRLAIIYIPYENPLQFQVIPVPYMRMEVEMMFNHYRAENPVKENQFMFAPKESDWDKKPEENKKQAKIFAED